MLFFLRVVIFTGRLGVAGGDCDLYRETSFPDGCFLMTGAGVVPDPTFTLNPGDDIRISIQGIGELCNHVEVRP